jgi:hypothetical protein
MQNRHCILRVPRGSEVVGCSFREEAVEMPEQPSTTVKPTLLAELYLHPSLPREQVETLERWRVRVEREKGPTDQTKYFTSMRPLEQQEWLICNYPEQWYEGLPEFYKAAVKNHLRSSAAEGCLDDEKDGLVRLWIERLSSEQRSR